MVGEGFGDDMRLYVIRFLERGDAIADIGRASFKVYQAHDESVPRLRRRRHGHLVHTPGLHIEDELNTSAAYNDGLPRTASQQDMFAASGFWGSTVPRWRSCAAATGSSTTTAR